MNKFTKKSVSPLAGKPAPESLLVNIPKLITCYYSEVPDFAIPSQRVLFGTSGHRGSSFNITFNEWHIIAITQAICLYRKLHKITGPLFLGIDTHALSIPAYASALEVLVANGVHVLVAKDNEYTPTPVVSHAILHYNKKRKASLADGIVITPSHNPPEDGGFKYDPPNGGPADVAITQWIENKANEFLKNKLQGVKRILFSKAEKSRYVKTYDFLNHYINDLGNVINMDLIRRSKIAMGVDPLGGAGVHYWEPIAERYKLNLTIMNNTVDPTFRFMTVDWDGKIRMNPASPYAMVDVIKQKNKFDIAFACDTDHDRHGIVTPKGGLITPNHYLSVAVDYLLKQRPHWSKSQMIAKTVVTTEMLRKISAAEKRSLYEVPVGFKWFVDGIINNSLAFCGEQSAGATFSRINGKLWTTDKDGIIAALLSAEITAKTERDIADIYHSLEHKFGKFYYELQNSPATTVEKNLVKKLSAKDIKVKQLAGDKIKNILIKAPGDNAPIAGIKVISDNGWFVARPSGTEAIYEISAESFKSKKHLMRILKDARSIVNQALHKQK